MGTHDVKRENPSGRPAREEALDAYVFDALEQVRAIPERGREIYNTGLAYRDTALGNEGHDVSDRMVLLETTARASWT